MRSEQSKSEQAIGRKEGRKTIETNWSRRESVEEYLSLAGRSGIAGGRRTAVRRRGGGEGEAARGARIKIGEADNNIKKK